MRGPTYTCETPNDGDLSVVPIEGEILLDPEGESGWNLRAYVDVTGSPEIVRFELIRQDQPESRMRSVGVKPVPFTSRLLRAVRLTDVLAQANRFLDLLAVTGRLPSPKQLGKQGTDHRLATIAAYYVDALKKGSRRPRADAAERLGISSEQVRDALHEARRRGLLTDANQGRAEGALTAEANRILGRTTPDGAR